MTEPAGITAPTVFFVSDGTGVTAETLGHSVMAQFEKLKYRQQRMPFVDSVDKARDVLQRIDEARVRDGRRPIVFSTLVNPEINRELRKANALILDLFESFVEPLENELGTKSTHTIGRFHNATESESYKHRIEAINFSLAHDDGQSTMSLQSADVILVGVSRSGKTPTSLYLAMQFGIKAANYPLIPDDFERNELPSARLRAQAQAVRPVDRTRAPGGDPPRTPPQQPLRLARELPLRSGRGRAADAARRDPLAVLDHQVDRGDRRHDPAGSEARAARLLKR